MQDYYIIREDVEIPGRWRLGYLHDPSGERTDVYPPRFTWGRPEDVPEPVAIAVEEEGTLYDFSEAAFGIPVVSSRVAAVLQRLAPDDVQLVPVKVGGHTEEYFILNACRLVKCIDEESCSEVQHYEPEERRTGYRSVSDLRIDVSRVGGAKIFRPWGWEVVLIVSDEIRRELEAAGSKGARFEQVTGPPAIPREEIERLRRGRARLRAADKAREAVWGSIGTLETRQLAVVGKFWPRGGKAWRIILREREFRLLVTDGMTSPSYADPVPSVGLGLELALESDWKGKATYDAWPVVLLDRVGDVVAKSEEVRGKARAGLLTLEVSGEGMPKSLVTAEGRVGVLLGVASKSLPARFTLPEGEVQLVTVKALLPSELAYAVKHGRRGEEELAARFAASGQEHRTLLRRKPVV